MRLFLLAPLAAGLFGGMRHELDRPNLADHLPHHSKPSYNLSLWRMEMDKKIVPPTAMISEANLEPHLPSKETNRLRPAFVDIKEKFLDGPGPPRSI
ncbi:hypothetical protein AVEN_149365-1 [Araneus ventricosus]|uniref:Uncharacterized protein n=1 Tax=Araneus ventricosus TaxID=182803 RepID=A0A4Y2JFG9_ARAVE|nr:hypothetical protein AVEN_149365-1 [Araneus ventricosus]